MMVLRRDRCCVELTTPSPGPEEDRRGNTGREETEDPEEIEGQKVEKVGEGLEGNVADGRADPEQRMRAME
jgi:hypothetical protein